MFAWNAQNFSGRFLQSIMIFYCPIWSYVELARKDIQMYSLNTKALSVFYKKLS